MRGIVRHRNDQLLNASAISNYLAEVAPVPFREEFPFSKVILEHLGSKVRLGDLEILVGDEGIPVLRPHREALELGPGSFDRFTDIELLRAEGIDGETAYLGWVLHHGYSGALPANSNVRGLRIRCGNIQVGDDRIFEGLFPEPRFNGWSVGEIHVIDPRVTPNGRRDHFEQNVHFDNLLTHLVPTAREITRKCRASSVQRKWSRDFELREAAIRERIGIIKQGALGRNDRYRMIEEIRAGMAFLDATIAKSFLLPSAVEELKRCRDKLERDVSKIFKGPTKTQALLDVAPAKRRAYEHLIGLIYECSGNQSNAKLLVDKILMRIS
jgi:molecular chaperone HtpG